MKRWLEPRIEGPPADPDNPYVAVDIKFINDLWVPDIYVYFLKQINVLTVFTKFAGKCFQTLACQYEVRLGIPRHSFPLIKNHWKVSSPCP